MVNISINNKKVSVPSNYTILQACEIVGIQIPRFCYHEKLSIAGNCRMCLVHVDKSLKPVASCAAMVMDGMSIYTDSAIVKKAREGVMEFLLSNHPLDCPICDQGGECDLQDQALIFGNDRGRFYEVKRSVSDKNCGPLVKTVMTRCIHCTRCVRFSTELSGVKELGTTGRGSKTEIGNYVSKSLVSEVSGNVIDLCPVGALTSKPYAFTARSWELKRTESIDTMDSMGANISIQTAERKVARILPVLHEGINEEWLADKSRFSYDGYYTQRLLTPLFKTASGLKKTSWDSILSSLTFFLNSGLSKTTIALGADESLETLLSVKKLAASSNNFNIKYRLLNNIKNIDFRRSYLFNSSFSSFDHTDACLILGANLKKEMPLLLMRIRKEQRLRNLPVGYVGCPDDYGVEAYNIGNTVDTILDIIEGKHEFCSVLARAKKPMVIIGQSLISHKDFETVKSSLLNLKVFNKPDFDCLNFLNSGSGSVGSLELGLLPSDSRNVYKLISVGMGGVSYSEGTKVVHIGSHGCDSIKSSELILPSKVSIESDSLFVNTEGRVQQNKKVVSPSEGVRDGYSIINLINHLNYQSPSVSLSKESIAKDLMSVAPFSYNTLGYSTFSIVASNTKGYISGGFLSNMVESYYRTNPVSKASKNMSQCVENYGTARVRSYKRVS